MDSYTNDNVNLIPIRGRSGYIFRYDFPEISISSVQYTEGPVGCTYIRFNVDTAGFFCDERGGWPATYATDLSRTGKNLLRGICFAGGSLLGLEAAVGCVREEFKNTSYINLGDCHVVGAIIYSANLLRNAIFPDRDLGRFAVKTIKKNEVYLGQCGAGCSAGGSYYGQGAHFGTYKNIKIFVLTVVNAVGIIYDDDGNVIRNRWELIEKKPSTKNTTLTAVITNVSLDLFELQQLAIQCHTNMAVVIRPFHTMDDGDVLFSVTLNQINQSDIPDFLLEDFFNTCSLITNKAVQNCFEHAKL
jgi:6-aminohexanoate-oligomer endohydrolase